MKMKIKKFIALQEITKPQRNVSSINGRLFYLNKRDRARIKLSTLKLRELQTFFPQAEFRWFFLKAYELRNRDAQRGLCGIPDYVYLLRSVPQEMYRIVKHTIQNNLFRKVKRYSQCPQLVVHSK